MTSETDAATAVDQHADEWEEDEDDDFRCSVCGVSECLGDPVDCEANLRTSAHGLGRAYAVAVASAAEAARAGDSKFASETFAVAEELFAGVAASSYWDLCFESLHRHNWVMTQHSRAAADPQRAIRAVASRPLFNPLRVLRA